MRILVVDDEKMSHQLVGSVVRVLGDYVVETATNGHEALEKAVGTPPDLIISDINMPDMDGLMLTERLRAHPALADVPILLLTARGAAQDKYDGFLRGADDYLVKPFDIMELQLRIKALLRRRMPSQEPRGTRPLAAGGLVLDERAGLVRYQAHDVRLTASELAIVRHLIEQAGRVVTAEALLNQALGYPPRVGNPQTVHSHIRNIRQKFRALGLELAHLTSSWQGYLLEAE